MTRQCIIGHPSVPGGCRACISFHTCTCPSSSRTQVYRAFIEAVDAVDNGVMQFALPSGTAPLYLNNTTLGARVGSLNPRWNQPSDDETLYKQVRRPVRHSRVCRRGGGEGESVFSHHTHERLLSNQQVFTPSRTVSMVPFTLSMSRVAGQPIPPMHRLFMCRNCAALSPPPSARPQAVVCGCVAVSAIPAPFPFLGGPRPARPRPACSSSRLWSCRAASLLRQ